MTRGLLKVHSSCKDGAGHLHQMLVKSRYLSPKHKRIVDPVIHRNAYFAHPENLLLAMMTDYRRHIRELGLRGVMKVHVTVDSCTAHINVDKYGSSRFPRNSTSLLWNIST